MHGKGREARDFLEVITISFFSKLADLLFPPKCPFCGRVKKQSDEPCCDRCVNALPFLRGEAALRRGDYFDVCVSPLKYEDQVRNAILKFKFRGRTDYAEYFGKFMADSAREHLAGKYNMITWVPLSSERKRTRGYDQAMLLALAAALELDDVAVETLEKTKDVIAQSTLNSAEERRENIKDVFAATDPDLIAGKRILLIDDIVTTGVTLSECSRALLIGGAESVVCATIASA